MEMKTQMKKKIKFLITKEDDWPPLKYESIWCRIEGDFYRIRNIPFFIDEVSFDDIVDIKEVDKGVFEIKSVIEKSSHSTIWMFICEEKLKREILDNIKNSGCGIEGGVLDNYYAINAPDTNILTKLCAIIDPLVKDEIIDVTYPSIKD